MAGKGKAIVAGGAGALGLSIARALRNEGYETHVTAIDAHEESRFKASPDVQGITCHIANFADGESVEALFRKVGGPLAAMVTTIGGFAAGPIAELTPEGIDKMSSLNVKTTLLALKGAYPYLKQNPGGAGVVVVAARPAALGGPGMALYAATKAAVANIALSAAQEWLKDGITVNAILPSTMDTPANRAAMPKADFTKWPKTDEVAHVAAFLVGEKARIVSGGAIPVYGKA